MKWNELSDSEKKVILDKGTERPFVGQYTDTFEKGTYICRQCNSPLYVSNAKFHSGCGWPSFDQEIKDAVVRVPDADGSRTEIICAHCKGHLGHVFIGEKYTETNTRHCVNSISMLFVPEDTIAHKAVFAGGCFWGIQYYFDQEPGVINTSVGYIGGTTSNPTYKEVCGQNTGHVEAIEITYDPDLTNFETLAKLFFEIHDPTQTDGQGPDIGEQYVSKIFYFDTEQQHIARQLIAQLEKMGMSIATELLPYTTFWKAEAYHQAYFSQKGLEPTCHSRTKRF